MLLAVGGSKGGVGKSTLAGGLAEQFAKRGLEVRCLDGDPQLTLAAMCEAAPGTMPPCSEAFPKSFAKFARLPGITVLDLPSGLGDELATALSIADAVLVPVTPGPADIRALPSTLAFVARARELRGGLPKPLLVVNRLVPKEAVSRQLLAEVRSLGWPVAATILHERAGLRRLAHKGVSTLPSASRRPAEAELSKLADEVLSFAGITEEISS